MNRLQIRLRAADSAGPKTIVPAAPNDMSPNDLALGFGHLRWGMSVKDAKALFPGLTGQPIEPMQSQAILSLSDYTYEGCAFVANLIFEKEKLTRLELEGDDNANFKHCSTLIISQLKAQYGKEPGGVSPSSPYQGYSLHAEWRGPVTDVVYNELQNAVIAINFSPTYPQP